MRRGARRSTRATLVAVAGALALMLAAATAAENPPVPSNAEVPVKPPPTAPAPAAPAAPAPTAAAPPSTAPVPTAPAPAAPVPAASAPATPAPAEPGPAAQTPAPSKAPPTQPNQAAPSPVATATRDLEFVPASEAEGILGKQVVGAAGENMGLVVDVIVDRTGAPRAAVVDFGGFLGVGSRKIAVDWRLLTFHPDDAKKPVILGLEKAALQAAPEYKPAMNPLVIVGPLPAPDPPDSK